MLLASQLANFYFRILTVCVESKQVGATPDLMVAYVDFFLGGDEKRVDMVSIIQKRFPMCILFGGDGSYMSPYSLHSDALLTNLLGQVSLYFPSKISALKIF